ncbi:MAG TPA: hypothetical protein VHB21_16705 [Minicystis sp.]|nr:hypothetical protein [Minicystis sp.]
MSQGSWGGGGGGGGWGGGGGGGYGPPPGGGGYGPPGGGGYGGPPGQPPGGGGYGGPPGGGYGAPPGYQQQQQPGGFAPPPAGYPPGYTPPTGGVVAWEDQSLGFFSRWWSTVREVTFNPRGFHAASAANDNPWPSITFAVTTGALVGVVYGAFLAVIYIAFGGIGAIASMGGRGAAGPAAAVFGMLSAMGIAVAILQPIQQAFAAFVGPWISGGIVHVCLAILKGTTKPYANTVRVAGYTHAATLWILVPVVGWLGTIIVSIISWAVGLDETHKCGIGKALGAIFMPAILLCLCCCGGYAAVFATAAATGGHHHH